MNQKKPSDFQPSEIEPKWQKIWDEKGVYKPNLDTAKKPFFNLMMFPYPSAEGLHVGSVFTFTGVDTYGRFKRMQGYDVFEPMGLDGFGIHSENYALKVGRHPKEQAKRSEENFYRQLKSIGNSFDWSRKLETYDPNYYKWTQWIFIQLFKAGLAYRKKAPVNFCPSCKTVLSDEQVIDARPPATSPNKIDQASTVAGEVGRGKCERCNTIVEKKDLEQWFFKITTYADRLLNNLEKLDWTPKVKIAQRDWIGKKEGINITYEVEESSEKIVCFTTRPDTNFGATFIVLGPEHPLLLKITTDEHLSEVKSYIEQTKKVSDTDRITQGRKKTGVFTGKYAINNLNGKKMPVWVSDFVLGNVGTGAVVGVPGHDKRDFEFAQTMKLPIIRVVVGKDGDKSPITKAEQVQEEEGAMINSEFLDGLDIHKATEKIMDYLEEKGWGKRVTTYHLRDWLISRQRYWGPPIPMIYCEKCEWQPVPDADLPVLLPDVKDWKPKGDGSSPLANHPEFYKTTCPNCKGEAKRETDVSDTFLDSSWYFFRYIATDLDTVPFPSEAFLSEYSENSASQKVGHSDTSENQKPRNTESSEFSEKMKRSNKWLPVSMYIGGAEHAVLHLLYSRFITMVFKDLKLIDFEEPYKRFYAHGLIIKDGAKMSKSKGNVINPDEYLTKYGVDVLRAYLRFVGPFDMDGDFRDSGIQGMEKFLKRVWTFVTSKNFTQEGEIDIYLKKLTHEITVELEHLRFNTSIAKLMMYYNFLVKKQSGNHPIFKSEILNFIKLLAPFVPFLAEELWERLGQNFSVHTQSWPKVDEEQLKDVWGYTIVIQINGKIRATMDAEELLSQEEAEKRAKEMDNVKKYLEGKELKKVVYVEGKILNFVVG